MRTRRSSAGLRRATLAPWIVPNSAWMLAIRRSSSPPPPSASPWLTLFVFPGRRAEESRLSDVYREYRRFFENQMSSGNTDAFLKMKITKRTCACLPASRPRCLQRRPTRWVASRMRATSLQGLGGVRGGDLKNRSEVHRRQRRKRKREEQGAQVQPGMRRARGPGQQGHLRALASLVGGLARVLPSPGGGGTANPPWERRCSPPCMRHCPWRGTSG